MDETDQTGHFKLQFMFVVLNLEYPFTYTPTACLYLLETSTSSGSQNEGIETKRDDGGGREETASSEERDLNVSDSEAGTYYKTIDIGIAYKDMSS